MAGSERFFGFVTWTRLAALLLVVGLVLFFRPYGGIRHDSLFYLGQAFLQLQPEIFSQDVFFAYGSQSSYTLFPQLLAWLLQYVPAGSTFLILTLLGRLLFVAAGYFLIKQLIPRQYRWWALLALLVMPSSYGGFGLMSYSEVFLTGRTFAEPLVLVSLGLVLQRRGWLAAMCWLLAAAIHPLQALPALILLWGALVTLDRRWLHLLWLPLLAFALSLFGVPLLVELFSVYDSDWYGWIGEYNRLVYISRWPLNNWMSLLCDLFLLYLASQQRTENGVWRWFLCAFWVGIFCFAVNFIAVDLLRMVWPTGLQVWRVQWLLHFGAVISLPWLIHRQYLFDQGVSIRLLLLVAVVVFGAQLDVYNSTSLAMFILLPLYILWPRLEAQIGEPLRKLLRRALLLALLLHAVKYVFFQVDRFISLGSNLSFFRLDTIALSHPLLIAALLFGAVMLWQRSVRMGRCLLMMGLLGFIGFGVMHWDSRSSWHQYLESGEFSQSPFGVDVEPGANVYWQAGQLLPAWLAAGRASYYVPMQGAGALFNRATAEELQRRARQTSSIRMQSEICGLVNGMNANDDCTPHIDQINELCSAEVGVLDYFVLSKPLSQPALGVWLIPQLVSGDKPLSYYLYRCSDFVG